MSAAIVADYDTKMAALRASVPNRLKELDGIAARHFAASLDEVANKARQAIASNAELALTLGVVRDSLLTTASDLELLNTWLKLKVPKIQDGGNYGVVRAYERRSESWRSGCFFEFQTDRSRVSTQPST